MKALKHIGKIANTGAKVLVVFRTLPGESDQALILPVANLPDAYHDSIMNLVETDQAQSSFEFGEIMFTRTFPDGRPMLQAMQLDRRLIKVGTSDVIMTPSPVNEISLAELNVLIAEQRNCTVDELCNFVSGGSANKVDDEVKSEIKEIAKVEEMDAPAPVRAQASTTEPLSDKDLAKSFRSQADAMYKEAARLRKQADELDPPQKKSTAKVKETTDA